MTESDRGDRPTLGDASHTPPAWSQGVSHVFARGGEAVGRPEDEPPVRERTRADGVPVRDATDTDDGRDRR